MSYKIFLVIQVLFSSLNYFIKYTKHIENVLFINIS